jgi:hypothetical protein
VTNARPEKQWPMVNNTSRRAFGAALFQDQRCRRLPRSLDAERAALDQVWGSSSGHQHGRGFGGAWETKYGGDAIRKEEPEKVARRECLAV